MNNKSKDSTATLKVVCAILFIAFTFHYIYTFQGDLLGMMQYAWSDGKTRYNREIGFGIIMAVALLLSFTTAFLTRLPQRFSSLIYFPAFLCMGLLTAVGQEGTQVTTSMVWLIAAPVLFVLYIVLLRGVQSFKPFLIPLRSTTFLSQPWWTNLMVMTAMMLLTNAMGNSSRNLHTRLEVERLCREQRWQDALDTGIPSYDRDSSMTMLRAMALARQGLLGEHLFNYDVHGGSRALWQQKDNSACFLLGSPYILWQTIGVVPRNTSEPVAHFMKKQIRRHAIADCGKDYLLCAYLLDKDLSSFARELPKHYALNDSLPKHYQEAYVLYAEKMSLTDSIVSSAVKADYADFLTTMRSKKNPTHRQSAIREAYFGTYWYYYYRQKE